MHYLVEPHAFPREVSTFLYIYIYIYIDIDIDIDWRWSFSQCLTDNKLQLNIIWSSKRFKLVYGI